ncbi:glutamate decarboxylase [Limosilactobacillus caecicola]|uniref:glutamate decarboxylase n=1 Tax=Limosilactobacillus caecicola TaxID=2941332 RepID=UPI00203F1AF4|nr:glutamate decarboxylase [Limosilactobacillus caecicola]
MADINDALEQNWLGSVEAGEHLPEETMPEKAMNPNVAEQLIQHFRLNEAKANQNLATFCSTQMEPQADKLMASAMNTNAIDKSEYPKTAAMEDRCAAMIGHMWGIPENEKFRKDFIGTSTVGSSEACMLGGLSMLFSWKHRAKANGIDIDDLHNHKPNMIIGSGYQVVWEKFCTYWNVEMRQVKLEHGTNESSLNIEKAMSLVDENTIGIVAVFGITFTGEIDDVQALDAEVTKYNEAHKDMPIKIHVDAAYNGFFAPWVDGFKPWDFRLKNVASINVSGHKYGMVYPGLGWTIWRKNDYEHLPKEMRFSVPYLGGSVDSIAINFSHSGAHIVGQYYNLIRFGKEGFRAVMENVRKVSTHLSEVLKATGYFEMITDGSLLPINTWKLRDDVDVKWNLYDMEDALRSYGWQVPAYPLPKDRDDETVERIVVRPGMDMTIADDFAEDLNQAIADLNKKFN